MPPGRPGKNKRLRPISIGRSPSAPWYHLTSQRSGQNRPALRAHAPVTVGLRPRLLRQTVQRDCSRVMFGALFHRWSLHQPLPLCTLWNCLLARSSRFCHLPVAPVKVIYYFIARGAVCQFPFCLRNIFLLGSALDLHHQLYPLGVAAARRIRWTETRPPSAPPGWGPRYPPP